MKPLPRHLQQAVATLSVTVQELVFEVAMWAVGMPSELPPKPDSGVEGAWQRNHPTPEDTENLRDYIYSIADPSFVDRCAIGVAAIAGRTAAEMDEFFGWENVARYRLKWLRSRSRKRTSSMQ